MNITIISAITGILSLIAFVVSLNAQKAPMVGDVYSHGNPGNSYEPDKKACPFVQMETVLEINRERGLAKIRVQLIDVTGRIQDREKWEKLSEIGRFDKLIHREETP